MFTNPVVSVLEIHPYNFGSMYNVYIYTILDSRIFIIYSPGRDRTTSVTLPVIIFSTLIIIIIIILSNCRFLNKYFSQIMSDIKLSLFSQQVTAKWKFYFSRFPLTFVSFYKGYYYTRQYSLVSAFII